VKTDQDIAADTSLQVSLQGDDLNGNATAATLNDDVTVSQNTVTFAAGAKAGDTVQFTVDAKSDSTVESLEGFKVSLLDENFQAVATDIVSINDTTQPTGQSLVLTNTQNQNTGGADNLTGAGADDTFIATADGALGNGDVIDGAGGTDTLTARYVLDDNTSVSAAVSNVEQFNVDIDEGDANNAETLTMAAGFTGLSEVNVRNADSTDANEDTVSITQVADGVDLGVENGDGEFNVTFALATATGTSDAVTANLDTADVNTVTIDAVETVTLNAENGDSEIDTLTTDDATTLNITGSGGLTTDVDAATTTIDASAATGDLSLAGIGAVDSAITMGSGDDTVNMAGNLTDDDTIDGGDGTDRLIVDGDQTAARNNLSNIEEIELAQASVTNTDFEISGVVNSGFQTFVVNVAVADAVGVGGDDSLVTFSNVSSGDTIRVEESGADADDDEDLEIAATLATDSASDEINLSLQGVGALSADDNDGNDHTTGLGATDLGTFETINIVADSANNEDENTVEDLTASVAESIVITGSGNFDLDAITNTSALTSIDASALAGSLDITGIDASDITIKMGGTDADDDSTVDIAGLNASDQIVGGAGDADTVTAGGITGLTATTGKLNIQDVENVELTVTGANTIDASLLSGVSNLTFIGDPDAVQTVTNLAGSGTAIALGDADTVLEDTAEIDISLADATGTSDAVSLNVNTNGGAGTDAAIDMDDVETLNVDVLGTNNAATLDLTDAAVNTLTMIDGGGEVTLGTLNDATTTVDLSGFDGEASFTAGEVSSGMTVTASSLETNDDYTLSGEDDTLTVAQTAGGVEMDVDGGAGTDTLGLTLADGAGDFGDVDNFEVLNLDVVAGADVTIGANGAGGTDANAIAEATNVTITGGNSLSTFEVGDSDGAAADTIDAAVDIDASAFAGNVFLDFANDVVTSTVDVDAGSLTTDTVAAAYTDDAATDVTLQTTGVEEFIAYISDNDNGVSQATFDLSDQTGLETLALAASANGDTFDVDEYVSSVTVQLGAEVDGAAQAFGQTDGASELDVNLASASGNTDTVNLQLRDTNDGDNIDVDAAGAEVLNIALTDDAESHSLDLAGVTASTGQSVSVNVSGGVAGDGLTISNAGSTIDTIDASESDGSLTISDRDASAMTITGGSDADTIRMENEADVLTGGDGTDTLTIVQNAVLGGFKVDLSASGDQVTTYNGAANAAVQSGFENVDLSNVTGTNGADITANADGSTITGTSNADQITLGAGTDTVVFEGDGSGEADTISSFTAGTDIIDFDTSAVAGADGTATDRQVADLTAGAVATQDGLIVVDSDSTDAFTQENIADLLDGTDSANALTLDDGDEAFYVAVDNGTDSAIALVDDAGGNEDDTIDDGEITIIATLDGVGDATTLNANSFADFA
jgi:hypothetical protein